MVRAESARETGLHPTDYSLKKSDFPRYTVIRSAQSNRKLRQTVCGSERAFLTALLGCDVVWLDCWIMKHEGTRIHRNVGK